MGSKLWSVEFIIGDFVHPMQYNFGNGNYDKASSLLYQLNCFFLGFSKSMKVKVGVEDMPKPEDYTKGNPKDIWERSNPKQPLIRYYTKYAPLVTTSMGIYIGEVLKHIEVEN